MKLPGFWILSFICLMKFAKPTAQEEPRIVCYYDSSSMFRRNGLALKPENIDPNLCTHLIYTWGSLSLENDSLAFDKFVDILSEGYARFNDLKTSNKNLKTLLSIGGTNIVSRRFSLLVAAADRRRTFAKNAIIFLRQYHFDGLDINLQNPTDEAYGKQTDRENYAQFIQELRDEFDRESSKTKRSRLLLTIGIPPTIDKIKQGYDVVKLNQYIDWFNILSYDYYYDTYESTTKHLAPLYSLKEDDESNVNSSVQFLIAAGADRQKIVLGIPTYGKSFTLFKLDATGIGAPANGPGNLDYIINKEGFRAYYDICEYIKSDDKWTVVHPNDTVMGPYLYKDDQWISYDDKNIARKKAQYAANNGLGGIVFSAIDMDDFTGSCSGKPYPIIKAAKKGLYDAFGNRLPDHRENKVTTTPQNKPTQTTTVSNVAVTSLIPDSNHNKKNTKSKSVIRTARPPLKLEINSDGSEGQNNSEENTFVGAENDDPQNTTSNQYMKKTTSKSVYRTGRSSKKLEINSNGFEEQNNSEENTFVGAENDVPQNTTPTQYRKNTTSKSVSRTGRPPKKLEINSDGFEEQNNSEENTFVVAENDVPQNTTSTQYRKNTTSKSVYRTGRPPKKLEINSDGSEGQNNFEENTFVGAENDDPQNTTPTQYMENTTSKSVYRTRRPPMKLEINSDGSEEQNNSEENTFVGTENDDPQNTTPNQYRKNTTSKSVYRTRRPPKKLEINSDGSEGQNNSEENTFVGAENDDPQNTTPTQYMENTTSKSVYRTRRPPMKLEINSDGSEEQNNSEENTFVVAENDDPQNTTPTQYRKNTTSKSVYRTHRPPTKPEINSDGSEEQNNSEENIFVGTENDDPQNTTPTQYRKNTTSKSVYRTRRPPTKLEINSDGSEEQNNSAENTFEGAEDDDFQGESGSSKEILALYNEEVEYNNSPDASSSTRRTFVPQFSRRPTVELERNPNGSVHIFIYK